MDCKADRKNSHMYIQNLVLEPGLKKTEAFVLALGKELTPFMQFNECTRLKIHRCSPPDFKPELERFVAK